MQLIKPTDIDLGQEKNASVGEVVIEFPFPLFSLHPLPVSLHGARGLTLTDGKWQFFHPSFPHLSHPPPPSPTLHLS